MADETILHQDDVEEVIDDEIEAGVGMDNAAIADAAAVGSSYSQAEVDVLRTKINQILAVLRNNGIILPN